MKTLETIRFSDNEDNLWDFGEEHTLRMYQPSDLFQSLPDGSVFLDVYEKLEAGIPFWVVVRNSEAAEDRWKIGSPSITASNKFAAEIKTSYPAYPHSYQILRTTEGVAQVGPYVHSSSVYMSDTSMLKALCAEGGITVAVQHSNILDKKDFELWKTSSEDTKETSEYADVRRYFSKLATYINNMFYSARDLFTSAYMLKCDINKDFYKGAPFADIAKTLICNYHSRLSINISNILLDRYQTSLTLPNFRKHLQNLLPKTSGQHFAQVESAIELLPTQEIAEEFFQSYTIAEWHNIGGEASMRIEKPTTQYIRNKMAAHTEEGLLKDESPFYFRMEDHYRHIQDVLIEMRMVIDALQYVKNAVFSGETITLPENTDPNALFNANLALAFSEIKGTGI